MKKILLILLSAAFGCQIATAQDNFTLDCFGIIAGKNATVDGSVLFAHNEDDGGEQALNVYIHPENSQEGTPKYIWAEFPGMSVADSFMNGYGVCIASDGCSSREDRDDFTDGGVLYEVRVTVGQHATSARDAVRIIGELVESRGYTGSGRTYLVADPNEGWIVSVVKGRHWVAQRVPDDEVLSIPNCYTISNVDLADTANFAGSPDIIDYAIERGFYNPKTDGEFSFRKAYAAQATFERPGNSERHSRVINSLLGEEFPYDIYSNVPFSVKPAKKVSVQDMINLLSIHGDKTEDGSHSACVCAKTTILSTVFQLRADMPREIGCVMWNCSGHPCAGTFVPWYLGMTKSPKGWQRFATAEEALEKHFSDSKDLRVNYPKLAYWKAVDKWTKITENYSGNIREPRAVKRAQQAKLFKQQKELERKLAKASPKRAARLMNRYTAKWTRSVAK